jgi:glycosyltransferase involved in cell wall biosynthesis
MTQPHRPVYCWIGGARYNRPLDTTNRKKWQALTALNADLRVIGFESGVRFMLLPAPPLGLLRHILFFTLGTLLALWQARRADTLIAQSPHEGAVGALAKQVAGLFGRRVRLVVESHGDFEQALFLQRRVSLAGLYRGLMDAFARYALRHADALRAISSTTEAQLVRFALRTPVVRFMAWTDAETFIAAGEARTNFPSRSREIVYAGVLTPLKNVHVLIEAFARGAPPDARLWLIGKPENATYADELRAQVARLGVADRVTFAGMLSQTELAAQMARARVLVLPSASEGLGRVLVEALLCGTPVIGTRVGGIPDVVRDNENGLLIPPNDADALADALARLYADDALVDRFGEQGRAFALSLASTEAFVQGYRALLMR